MIDPYFNVFFLVTQKKRINTSHEVFGGETVTAAIFQKQIIEITQDFVQESISFVSNVHHVISFC